jgi:hypothetical protein
MMIGQLWCWLRQQRNEARRRLDTEVLWPRLLHQACGDLRAARNAFRLHISLDPAWRDLGKDERDRIVDGLH